jgi:hypothetical protein
MGLLRRAGSAMMSEVVANREDRPMRRSMLAPLLIAALMTISCGDAENASDPGSDRNGPAVETEEPEGDGSQEGVGGTEEEEAEEPADETGEGAEENDDGY